MKGRKKGSSRCQRVITFCRKLQEYTGVLPHSAITSSASSDAVGDTSNQQELQQTTTNSSSTSGVAGIFTVSVSSPQLEVHSMITSGTDDLMASNAVPSISTVSIDTPPQVVTSVVASATDNVIASDTARNIAKRRACKTPKVRKVSGKRRDNTECHSCGYTYGDTDDPLIDDPWLTCSVCKKWSHESCGKVMKKKYVCNISL